MHQEIDCLDYSAGDCVIYALVNRANGKLYIGCTQHFYVRSWTHIYNLRRGNHKNLTLQADWRKFGERAFIFYGEYPRMTCND